MTSEKNTKSFRSTLETGEPQLGLCVMYPSPGVVERICPDWDWIWIDGQHGEMGYQDILAQVRACNLVALSYGDPLVVLDSQDHRRATHDR